MEKPQIRVKFLASFYAMIQHGFLLLLLCVIASCSSSKSTVYTTKLPGFDKQVPDHILFLDFSLKKATATKPETVRLVNTAVGSGQMKDLGNEVHNPYQIKALHYYTDAAKPTELVFEHPLYKSVEVFDPSGEITRRPTTLREGTLSMRLQHSNTLTKIELYSLTPDTGTQLIYTLTVN